MHSTYLKNVHTLLLGNLANTCLASKRMSSTSSFSSPSTPPLGSARLQFCILKMNQPLSIVVFSESGIFIMDPAIEDLAKNAAALRQSRDNADFSLICQGQDIKAEHYIRNLVFYLTNQGAAFNCHKFIILYAAIS